jgi:polyisoprenoid-binding protein YceI
MKKIILLFTVIAAYTLTFALNPGRHVDVYKLNTTESSLEWGGKKMTGEHKGTIQFKSGELSNDHGNYSGTFVIDMTTIKNTDLEGKPKERLEGHLKSDDFFGVDQYPVSTFIVTSIKSLPPSDDEAYTHTISGNLTIRDKTHPLSFYAVMKTTPAGLLFNGVATIDRSKYNVKYGSKTFFNDIGDKMIYDEFTLRFNVVLNK